MLKQTTDEQIENCLVAIAMIRELPPRRFTHRLGAWSSTLMRDEGPDHCGSAACFGGWVAVHPHFQAKGVFPDPEEGFPRIAYSMNTTGLARALFGNEGMFQPATGFEVGKEKQVVLQRIEGALDLLLGETE
jgi:hypothetical protein